jgi:hypothetical protein
MLTAEVFGIEEIVKILDCLHAKYMNNSNIYLLNPLADFDETSIIGMT